jgi:hypothetical protein
LSINITKSHGGSEAARTANKSSDKKVHPGVQHCSKKCFLAVCDLGNKSRGASPIRKMHKNCRIPTLILMASGGSGINFCSHVFK